MNIIDVMVLVSDQGKSLARALEEMTRTVLGFTDWYYKFMLEFGEDFAVDEYGIARSDIKQIYFENGTMFAKLYNGRKINLYSKG